MAAISERHGPPGLGLVQVYTGDGKGKTTAALGLALRAAGWGLCTFIGQFMKGQDYGELRGVAMLAPYVAIEQFGRPRFLRAEDVTAEDISLAGAGLRRIAEVMASGRYQIVVLDEVCVALYFGLFSLSEVLALVEQRPVGVEVVLTGRRAPQELLAVADLVTEVECLKHPYMRGIAARRGIEF